MMSAGLRAAIIAVREFPPTNERRGKLELGRVLKKVRLGHRVRGASLLRQGSNRVTVQDRVKLRVVELIVKSGGQRKLG